MFTNTLNKAIGFYLSKRTHRIDQIRTAPVELQQLVFRQLLEKGKKTQYGLHFDFKGINSYQEFASRVPIIQYDDIKSYIHKMMMGESDILWPGEVKWFAKSSGTTSDKSKYIPMTKQILQDGHMNAAWDAMTIVYDQIEDAQMFAQKSLMLGGSLQKFQENPNTRVGDVSAILLHHMPLIGRPFYTPDIETALIEDMDEKINKIIDLSLKENVVMFAGVPTWLLVLFSRVLEKTGKSNILEVWPDLQLFMHGGVGFAPYKEQFSALVPRKGFNYMEIFNASEGYFGMQDVFEEEGMLLMLNHSVFYEFIPLENINDENPEAIPLGEVELGKTYAMVITTASGLWRYQNGDTVQFTSVHPYRVRVSGRTKHFINVFGEEVMVSNTDKAISLTSKTMGLNVSNYTVAPIFLDDHGKGGHQWLIEFDKRPDNLSQFEQLLDSNLQQINSDYEAKRFKDIALQPLQITSLKPGTFNKWLSSKKRIGAQSKIPRLSNSREYVEQILAI